MHSTQQKQSDKMKTNLTRCFVEAVKSDWGVGTQVEKIHTEERNNPGTAIAVVREAASLLGVPFRSDRLENSFSTNLIFRIGRATKSLDYTGSGYRTVCTPSAICDLLNVLASQYWAGRSRRWSRRSGDWGEYIPHTGRFSASDRAGYFLFLRAVYDYAAGDALTLARRYTS